MKYRGMNVRGNGRVNVPELAGGLNLREIPSQCLDNQLTELLNMWYKDGSLRTRPGCETKNTFVINTANYSDNSGEISEYNANLNKHDVYRETSTGRMRLCSAEVYKYDEKNSKFNADLYFFWCGKSEIITRVPVLDLEETTVVPTYFVAESKGYIYLFLSTKKIYKTLLSNTSGGWQPVEKEEYYVPTVAMSCKASGYTSMSSDEALASGVMIEGYNLLSDYYKISYNAYNIEAGTGEDLTHVMVYGLLENVSQTKYAGMTVTAEYTTGAGANCTHTVTLTGGGESNEISPNTTDGLKMKVCGPTVTFFTQSGSIATLSEGINGFENNLVFTAPYIPNNRDTELKKIFNMTRTTWFGGKSEGMAGGTRLFLCGNTEPNEKALVCWSGLNNPLYFPENSNFYVGNAAESVTGFGKQSEMLIIFKDNETWYTQYTQNTSITAADLISQKTVDIQASAVYFPLVQINPNIGCPYPDTVELCRNRLVWLGDNGNVYTLVSASQYNERSIFCVSEMIKSRLAKENANGFTACDWDGYYVLSNGKHVFLLDYNCYGYSHISSYSKTEDANIKIPWYYWEIDSENGITFCMGDSLLFLRYIKTERISNDKVEIGFISEENKTFYDDDKPIRAMAQTKLFDFGEANRFKGVGTVGLSLGYNDGEEITVTFVSDGGEDSVAVMLEDEAEERTAGFTKSVLLSPAICSSVRFGIRLECDGNMIIDGLTMDYRMKGRAR